jgi:hypothetical protein
MNKISTLINNLIWVKYRWWHEGDFINETGPFYYDNKPVPSLDIIQKDGINLPGVIIEDFNISHGWFNGTYIHVSLPKDWLLKLGI